MSYSQNNIIPKDCVYGCNTKIYWNTAENSYFEVFTKKKHICPNRSNNKPTTTTTTTTNTTAEATVTKPTYYNKKPWSNTIPKPKMSNSLELLTGPISEIQRKYEILSDIVTEANGKVHGSQSHMVNANVVSLIVYYEVPEGQRDEVKHKFGEYIHTNLVGLQRNG
jgi:hypothetical protein